MHEGGESECSSAGVHLPLVLPALHPAAGPHADGINPACPRAPCHAVQVKPSYKVLDEFRSGCVDGYPSVLAIIAESKQLQEAQELFELYQSDYLKLQRCNEELGYLKSLWDMVGAVMYTFNDWYKTPWDKIDVDFLMEETKKLSKDIKTLNKAVRNYDVYRLLEEAAKAMLTSLPLVQVRGVSGWEWGRGAERVTGGWAAACSGSCCCSLCRPLLEASQLGGPPWQCTPQPNR